MTTSNPSANSLSPAGVTRIHSVDILRGIVMVLMAIDHVRVYSGIPAGAPDPGIFFTRWITHFCAPGFVFLTGTSAFLYGIKTDNKKNLTRFLLSRGALLVVLELTLIRFCWTFNFDYSEFVLAGVIWMIGWCMILLAFLVKLKPMLVGIIGLAIILLQQLFSLVPKVFPESMRNSFGLFWEFIYPAGLNAVFDMTVLYVIVPWIGVMAAGYGFGLIVTMEPDKRKKLCLRIGLTCIILFIVGGSLAIMLSPATNGPPFLFKLLNQQKYPASQLFLLMTLGPMITLIPIVENAQSAWARIMTIFGRVPFFYYLIHIPFIHISALVVRLIIDGSLNNDGYANAPFTRIPEEQRWSLGLLYLIFLIDVAILFFLCRWYARYKGDHAEKKWLQYI